MTPWPLAGAKKSFNMFKHRTSQESQDPAQLIAHRIGKVLIFEDFSAKKLFFAVLLPETIVSSLLEMQKEVSHFGKNSHSQVSQNKKVSF